MKQPKTIDIIDEDGVMKKCRIAEVIIDDKKEWACTAILDGRVFYFPQTEINECGKEVKRTLGGHVKKYNAVRS